jgi:hypothetical protein
MNDEVLVREQLLSQTLLQQNEELKLQLKALRKAYLELLQSKASDVQTIGNIPV